MMVLFFLYCNRVFGVAHKKSPSSSSLSNVLCVKWKRQENQRGWPHLEDAGCCVVLQDKADQKLLPFIAVVTKRHNKSPFFCAPHSLIPSLPNSSLIFQEVVTVVCLALSPWRLWWRNNWFEGVTNYCLVNFYRIDNSAPQGCTI